MARKKDTKAEKNAPKTKSDAPKRRRPSKASIKAPGNPISSNSTSAKLNRPINSLKHNRDKEAYELWEDELLLLSSFNQSVIDLVAQAVVGSEGETIDWDLVLNQVRKQENNMTKSECRSMWKYIKFGRFPAYKSGTPIENSWGVLTDSAIDENSNVIEIWKAEKSITGGNLLSVYVDKSRPHVPVVLSPVSSSVEAPFKSDTTLGDMIQNFTPTSQEPHIPVVVAKDAAGNPLGFLKWARATRLSEMTEQLAAYDREQQAPSDDETRKRLAEEANIKAGLYLAGLHAEYNALTQEERNTWISLSNYNNKLYA